MTRSVSVVHASPPFTLAPAYERCVPDAICVIKHSPEMLETVDNLSWAIVTLLQGVHDRFECWPPLRSAEAVLFEESETSLLYGPNLFVTVMVDFGVRGIVGWLFSNVLVGFVRHLSNGTIIVMAKQGK